MCSGSHIAFPPLSSWANEHFSAITTAPTRPNFSPAFDNFFSENVSVVFNGEPLTRPQYELQLFGTVSPVDAAVLDIQNIVSVSNNLSTGAGSVGIFYSMNFSQPNDTRQIQSSLNLLVAEDKSIASHCGEVDQRRVISLNQVILSQGASTRPTPVQAPAPGETSS